MYIVGSDTGTGGDNRMENKVIQEVWNYYFTEEKSQNKASTPSSAAGNGVNADQTSTNEQERISDDGRIKLAKRLAQFFRNEGSSFVPQVRYRIYAITTISSIFYEGIPFRSSI